MIKAENFIIADRKEAEQYGFCIEGDVCFIFELGHYSFGCLGQGDETGHEHEGPFWRFDTIDHDSTPYSFEEDNLTQAIVKAQAIAQAVACAQRARELDDKAFALLLHFFKCT